MKTVFTKFYHIILLTTLVLIPNIVSAQVDVQDSLALVDLYNSTNGPNWTNHINWLNGPVSTWNGITVTNSRVTGINLYFNNLSGNIPNTIGNLTNLQYLSLGENKLIGNIPSSIGSLIQLQNLSIRTNQLTGSIPSTIGNLANLTNLDLSSNQLNGSIPISIVNLYNLQFLILSYNQLTGDIPVAIGNLTNLKNIVLSTNQLSGDIPMSIGSLINLSGLDLQSNQISGTIPTSIGNLFNLVNLDLTSNKLSGNIPTEIGNLTKLAFLKLGNNQLTGEIPPTVGNFTSLQQLILNNNQLTGEIPSSIGNLNILHILDLSNNQLTGEIPSFDGNLNNLIYLYLFNNKLTGNIPSSIGNLTKLFQLFLFNNQLISPIPQEVANLPNLSNPLGIQNNKFVFDKGLEIITANSAGNSNYNPQDSIPFNVRNGNIFSATGYVYEPNGFDPSDNTKQHITYYWYKNGNLLDSTVLGDSIYILPLYNSAESATYWCVVKDSKVPNLTLYSKHYTAVPYFLPYEAIATEDSLALVNLYNSTNGPNWTNHTNWLTTAPVRTWYGVTVDGNRVISLSLANNNLSGSIPASVGNLSHLISLHLDNNKFTFAGLEPFVPIVQANTAIKSFAYYHQASLPVTFNNNKLYVSPGGTFANNTVNWYKVGTDAQLQTGHDTTLTPAGDGQYYATISNSVATALMLQSNTFQIGTGDGAALNFDGVNDYVSIPHNSLLKPTTGITIEAWIKPTNIHTNTYYEIYRKEDGNDRHLLSFQNNGTILSFGLGVAGSNVELHVAINASDYENQWVHVAATFDGTTKKIYRNGVLIGSLNTPGAIGTSGTAPAIIGSLGGSSEFFNGTIDELSVWNRALSATEIQNSLTCEINPAGQSGLIALYHFNQGFGGGNNAAITALNDISGNNINGTLNGFSLSGSTSNWVSQGGVQAGVHCVLPLVNQGNKLVGGGTGGNIVLEGRSVSISADGNTAIIGGEYDNNYAGAAWVFARSNGLLVQQGNKLVGADTAGSAGQGYSVSISADGNTAVVGGPSDNSGTGAAWIFVRNNNVWTQQGPKLVGTGAVGNAAQGFSVAISADGNTVIIGGRNDNSQVGAAWVFTRSNGVWTQQGNKLVGTGSGVSNPPHQGHSVSISGDGNTAIVGAVDDNVFAGAAWVFTRSDGVWVQQGSKLTGAGNAGNAQLGESVSLSADGNTAIVGGFADNNETGAAWVFTRSNSVWTQQGNKLVGTGNVGSSRQGIAVSLSGDGNRAVIGGYYDNSNTGAIWVFNRSNGIWTQQGNKLTGAGSIGKAQQGNSVSLSADGNTAIAGGYYDNNFKGAAWTFDLTPFAVKLCPGDNFAISSDVTGSQYQWQVKSPNFSDWLELSNSPNDYFGTSSATQTLTRNNIDSYWAGTKFRCKVNNANYSSVYSLSFKSQWTGNASTLWGDAANWSCGMLPDAYTDVIINSGTVTVNANATCRSINIAPGVNFTVNTGVTFTITHQ